MSDRPNGNHDHDVAVYVAQYRKMETVELRDLLTYRSRRGTTPWQRVAIQKVLRERGE
jgi:hypothetical protein